MANRKPYSDTEIRPETPEVLRYLDRMHHKSPDWKRGAGITDNQRGLGVRIITTDGISSEEN